MGSVLWKEEVKVTSSGLGWVVCLPCGAMVMSRPVLLLRAMCGPVALL